MALMNLTYFFQRCQEFLGDRLLRDLAELLAYSYDHSKRMALPDAVVFPVSTEEVARITQLCNEYHVPLVARGRGTGTPGGSVPVQGGVVMSFERMNKILKMDPANRVMVVQPGVINEDVQKAAAEHGFFWPPDPGSAPYCTIGGNLAYNSAGPRAVKYGTPRENTLGLEVVLGNGTVIRTGAYTTKGVVGYDLTRLLIGSEGTLGIITEATLKLTPMPESTRTLCAYYQNTQSANETVSRLMAQPITPCALEFLDGASLNLIRKANTLPIPTHAQALLIVEIDGPEIDLDRQLQVMTAICQHEHLVHLESEKNPEDRQKLWQVRKTLSPLLRTIAPKKINEDVVVPIAALGQLIGELEAFSQQYQIPIVTFGHAGNGNVHVNLLIDPDNLKEAAAANTVLEKMFAQVLALKGTVSGEHGIGYDKKAFAAQEIGPAGLALMRQIKAVFDPAGILNPGKIFR